MAQENGLSLLYCKKLGHNYRNFIIFYVSHMTGETGGKVASEMLLKIGKMCMATYLTSCVVSKVCLLLQVISY